MMFPLSISLHLKSIDGDLIDALTLVVADRAADRVGLHHPGEIRVELIARQAVIGPDGSSGRLKLIFSDQKNLGS